MFICTFINPFQSASSFFVEYLIAFSGIYQYLMCNAFFNLYHTLWISVLPLLCKLLRNNNYMTNCPYQMSEHNYSVYLAQRKEHVQTKGKEKCRLSKILFLILTSGFRWAKKGVEKNRWTEEATAMHTGQHRDRLHEDRLGLRGHTKTKRQIDWKALNSESDSNRQDRWDRKIHSNMDWSRHDGTVLPPNSKNKKNICL